MANDVKYGGKSRGLWRKVYGYSVNKPQVVAFVDSTTNTTMSVDLNRTLRHRDYYIIDGIIAGETNFTPPAPPDPIYAMAEYDEDLVSMAASDIGTGFFNFNFTQTPIVVLSVEDDSEHGNNVQIYGLSLSTSSFTFGLSAPFTGNVRYRAIYGTTYPASATSSFTGSITASAGSTNPGGQAYYTASFAALPGVPFRFLQTAWDFNGNMDVDVGLQTQSSSSSGATTEISAPMSSSIHYIAFYSST